MIPKGEIIFCFSDVIDLFKKHKKWIFGIGFVFSSVAFVLLMLKAPVYKSTGSFIDVNEKKEMSSGFNNLLSSIDPFSRESKCRAYMESKKVINEVVQKLGLQMTVQKEKRNLLFRVFNRYRQNLLVMMGKSLKDPDIFWFENVKYDNEHTLKFFIRFTSDNAFEILDHKKKIIKAGKVQAPVVMRDLTFTLSALPKKFKKMHLYSLHIAPLYRIYDSIRKQFEIKTDRNDKNILHLSFTDRNRFLTKIFLNELMFTYQNYLKEENNFFAQEQLNYLVKKQKQIAEQFEYSLDEYSKYLTKNLSNYGFMGIEDEAKTLMKPHQNYLQKLYQNDLELAKINCSLLKNSSSDQQLLTFYQKIQDLNRGKDALEIALTSRKDHADVEIINAHLKKLDQLRENKLKIAAVLKSVENKEKLDADIFISDDPKNIVSLWIEKLKTSTLQKNDVINYLKNYLRVLSVQERILNERAQHSDKIWQEFEGIDLKTAENLYLRYNQKLDQIQVNIHQIEYIFVKLDDENFELGSLSLVLEDSVSLDLIKKASELTFQLNDKKNLSDKDISRILEDLRLIRIFLKEHLNELLHVQNLQEKLYKEKIYGLQMVSLDRTNQEISILKEQLNDYISSKKKELIGEKNLIKEKVGELKTQMQNLPEKWKLEKKLKLQSEIALQMIRSILDLTESKTIFHHLNQIGSKPLDLAILPYSPVKDRALLLLVAAFIFGMFLGFLKKFLEVAKIGFTASINSLDALHQKTFGKISDQCDGPNIDHISDQDFETLRNMSHFIQSESHSVVSLISSEGPNFSHSLAFILGKCGKKTVLVNTDFRLSMSKSNEIGLLQYLNGKTEIPIQNFTGYDYIPNGGTSRFGNEILRSSSFQQFMKHLKEKYDIILVFSRMRPALAEAKAYLNFSDKIIISFEKETLKELSPFFDERCSGYVKISRSCKDS